MIAFSENIRLYQKIQEKMFVNWLAIETFNKIQLHLLKLPETQPKTGHEKFFGQKIQWQLKRMAVKEKNLSKLQFSYRPNEKTPYQPYMFGYHINENN